MNYRNSVYASMNLQINNGFISYSHSLLNLTVFLVIVISYNEFHVFLKSRWPFIYYTVITEYLLRSEFHKCQSFDLWETGCISICCLKQRFSEFKKVNLVIILSIFIMYTTYSYTHVCVKITSLHSKSYLASYIILNNHNYFPNIV